MEDMYLASQHLHYQPDINPLVSRRQHFFPLFVERRPQIECPQQSCDRNEQALIGKEHPWADAVLLLDT